MQTHKLVLSTLGLVLLAAGGCFVGCVDTGGPVNQDTLDGTWKLTMVEGEPYVASQSCPGTSTMTIADGQVTRLVSCGDVEDPSSSQWIPEGIGSARYRAISSSASFQANGTARIEMVWEHERSPGVRTGFRRTLWTGTLDGNTLAATGRNFTRMNEGDAWEPMADLEGHYSVSAVFVRQ
jgi:hypothetical protein